MRASETEVTDLAQMYAPIKDNPAPKYLLALTQMASPNRRLSPPATAPYRPFRRMETHSDECDTRNSFTNGPLAQGGSSSRQNCRGALGAGVRHKAYPTSTALHQ